MGGRYSMINNGKTHDWHAQLVGQRYHKGIALSPKFKGYILSNKQLASPKFKGYILSNEQLAARSNNSKGPTTAKDQQQQKSNNGKSPTMAKVQWQWGPMMAKFNNGKV